MPPTYFPLPFLYPSLLYPIRLIHISNIFRRFVRNKAKRLSVIRIRVEIFNHVISTSQGGEWINGNGSDHHRLYLMEISCWNIVSGAFEHHEAEGNSFGKSRQMLRQVHWRREICMPYRNIVVTTLYTNFYCGVYGEIFWTDNSALHLNFLWSICELWQTKRVVETTMV